MVASKSRVSRFVNRWVLAVFFLCVGLPTHAERAFIINLLPADTVVVVLSDASKTFTSRLSPGESTGYVPFNQTGAVLTASRDGQVLAEVQLSVPVDTDWTFVLAQTPSGALEWTQLPDHNHPFATYSLQEAHLASNAGPVTLSEICETDLGTGTGTKTVSYGYGTSNQPTLSKPLPGPGNIPIRCRFTADSDDGVLVATSQEFDSAIDSGNVYRVILGDDGSGGSRFYTFFQEFRGTTDFLMPSPDHSGLYFSQKAPGRGWALLADDAETAVMFFGFDDEGQPTWYSTREVRPRSDGSATSIIFEQYRRQQDGLLSRYSSPGFIRIATHGCGQMTAFLMAVQPPLSFVDSWPRSPQEAFPLSSIYGDQCAEGVIR